MADANEEYFDAALRRQIGVRQFTALHIREMLRVLEKSDQELVAKLRKRLGRIAGASGGVDWTSAHLRDLLREIRESRAEVMRQLRTDTREQMVLLARTEADFERRLLERTVPVELSLNAVSPHTLRALATSEPFRGRLLKEWFDSLAAADQRGIVEAIRLGLAQGEDVDTIVRRVVGTRKNNYSDGVLAITRRNAEAVVRTGINHVSNQAREALWEANEDIVLALRWTSTLDGRTTLLCAGLDGALAPIGDKPLPPNSHKLDPPDLRPPAHVNCRSIMVAVLDPEGIVGERPFVLTTLSGDKQKVEFRKIAKEKGISVSQARRDWAVQNVGRVPAKTTYNDWLKRQPLSFQEEVLGKAKAKLFRTGKLSLDQFTDRFGKELTLDQLSSQHPDVFRAAGLSP